MIKIIIASAIMGFLCFTPAHKTTVWMIGDSTMSIKEVKAFPETGWGMPFEAFFNKEITIENRAKNGRSTRTFISEKLWQPVSEQIKEGDYLLIQFGHNDESKEKTERYTTPEEYKNNLSLFVKTALAKKANPILITPVSRRKFKNGIAQETHAAYTPLVMEVAVTLNIPVIDLDKKSRELYQQWGEEDSKLFFLQLQPGEHPNYPEGKTDNTHFSELGARKIAQIVLSELMQLKSGLVEHVVKPAKK